MKNLLTRFKHWLIKKLGGYIEAPIQDPKIHCLSSRARFKLADLHFNITNEKIKSTLANSIARDIIDNNYLILSRSEDLRTHEVVFEACVYIMTE